MNRDQFNRTNMFNTVSAYLKLNKPLWISVKAVADATDELDVNIAGIEDKLSKQQTPTSGVTDQKASLRLAIEEKILELSDQLSALGAANDDPTLTAQTNWTLSSLDKLAEDGLEELGKTIVATTTVHLAALADYGITQADVTALSTLVTQYHSAKTGPRTVIAGRAGETSTLVDLISETTSLLRNRLDKLMTRFKKSSPEFYAGYQSARVIVDRGGSPVAAQPAPVPTPAVVK